MTLSKNETLAVMMKKAVTSRMSWLDDSFNLFDENEKIIFSGRLMPHQVSLCPVNKPENDSSSTIAILD